MPQQLNLLDASFQPRRVRAGSVAALAIVIATLALAGGGGVLLRAQAGDAQARSAALEGEAEALRTRMLKTGAPAAPSNDAAELARLRGVETAQRQVRTALESGLAGSRASYSEYLLALSRQTRPALWLTAFTVAADGRSLTLDGRMTDPRQLPEYLRRLNAEPLFKGREFAQLSLSTPAESGVAEMPPGTTEFALRSNAAVGPEAAR